MRDLEAKSYKLRITDKQYQPEQHDQLQQEVDILNSSVKALMEKNFSPDERRMLQNAPYQYNKILEQYGDLYSPDAFKVSKVEFISAQDNGMNGQAITYEIEFEQVNSTIRKETVIKEDNPEEDERTFLKYFVTAVCGGIGGLLGAVLGAGVGATFGASTGAALGVRAAELVDKKSQETEIIDGVPTKKALIYKKQGIALKDKAKQRYNRICGSDWDGEIRE